MKQMQEMPDSARVWVYQADRILVTSEVDHIFTKLTDFLKSWSSHGASLDSAFEVKYARFVIVAVDEEKALASGCGIDKLVHFFQELSNTLQVDFFNRMIVVYRSDDEIVSAPLHQFWGLRKARVIGDETIVFDNLVKNLADYRMKWETTFNNSWHAEMWGR
jgi:hypothetical protein